MIMNRLRFRDLRLVQEIYRSGSLRVAAENTNLTHPGASKILKDLEHIIGGELFKRSSKGMEPTEICERFIVFANQLTQYTTNYLADFNEANNGVAGKVIIGINPGVISTLLPETVSFVKERYPNIQLELVDGPAISFLPAVKSGKVDFIISRLSYTHGFEEFDEELLYKEPFAIACRRDHPLTQMEKPTLQDAARYPWIYPPTGSSALYELLQAFRLQDIELPKVQLTSISAYANKAIVMKSDNCTIFPGSFARQEHEIGSISILDIDLAVEPTPIAILKYRHRVPSSATESVIDAFRTVAKELAAK